MDALERNQVRLILERLSSETLRVTEEKQKGLYAEHAAKGLLRSGATVKFAIRNIEEQASHFVESAVDDVAGVAQDLDAFALISSSLTAVFRGYEVHAVKAVSHATAGSGDKPSSVKVAADKLFDEMRSRIFKQLEIHRFTFTKPSRGDMGARSFTRAIEPSSPEAKRNAGGKPLAKHWDAMWADIAVKLWNGDLQPQTQADLKTAMFAWFNEAGIEIGDTAVTQRARQLWQAMENAQS